MKQVVYLAVFVLAILVAAQTSDAAPISYFANLNGTSESPPTSSLGTGFAEVDFDSAANTLHVSVTFSGLTTDTTASHIHATTALPGTGNAGVATTVPFFTGFPIGVTSGTYDHTFDMTLASSWNPPLSARMAGHRLAPKPRLALLWRPTRLTLTSIRPCFLVAKSAASSLFLNRQL